MGQLECTDAHNGRAAAGEPPPSPPAPADPTPAPTPLAHRQRHQQLWRRGGACSAAGRPCYPLGLTRLPPELLSATTACGDGGSGGGSGREGLCEGMAAGAGIDVEGGSGAHRPPAAGPPSASNHLESDVGFGSSVGGSGGVFDRLSGGDLARCRAVHSSWRDWLDQGEEHEEGAAAEGLKQAVAAAEEEEETAGTGRRTGGSSKPRHWQASVGGGRRLLWQRAAVADGLYDLALNPAPEPKGQPQPADRSNTASIGCNALAGGVMGAAASVVGGTSDGPPGQQGPSGGCNSSSSSSSGSSSSAGGGGGHAAAGRAAGHQLYTARLADKAAQRLAWLTLISKDLPHTTGIVAVACLPAEELCGRGSSGGGDGGGGDEVVGGPPPRQSRTLACLERVVSRLALLLESGRVQLEVGDGGNAGQWQVEGPRELDGGGDGGHNAAQMSSLCHSLSSYREYALRGVGACGLTLREVAHTRGVALCGSAGCEQLAACEAHSKAASAHAARRVYTLRMALESLDLKAAAIAVGGNGDGDGGTAAAAHVAGILRRGMESGVRPALYATCEAIIGAATAIKHEMMAMLELSMKL